MAHTTLIISFCLLFGKVIALHTSVNQTDSPCSFVSKNKLFCAQAGQQIADEALDLFKSMPRGKLYDGTMLNLQLSCSDMGYTYSAGEDPCYPGLHAFYRSKEEGESFVRALHNHLREFAKIKNLTLDDVNFGDTCRCHERSNAKKNAKELFRKSCDDSRSLSNGPPRSFVSKNKLFCAQAQENIATDALNLFKSMPRGRLFDGSMLNIHKSCSDLGYKQSAGEDPCYPGLHTFYRNRDDGEHFYRELQNHLKAFGESKKLTLDDANFADVCKCQEKSSARSNVFKWFNKSCGESDAPRSFVSKNRLFCAQASQGIATDALNLFKSMPRGKLYDGTLLNFQLSCSDMGYTQSFGEDECYPGLHTFYHNKEDREHFMRELQNNLRDFGERKNLSLVEANFADTCKCHETSYAKSNVKEMFNSSCGGDSRTLFLDAPRRLRSFVSKNKLYCAQAQEGIAADALKWLKSMPRGKLYDDTILNFHDSCASLGYKQSAGDDPCYPELHTFYRNKEEAEHFYTDLQNHLREFGESKHLTLQDANFADTCKCQENSFAKNTVAKLFKKSCDTLNLTSLFDDAPHSFVSKNKLYCAQGSRSIANDALDMFKSMPRGKLFDGTILNSQLSCSDMGYTKSAGEDECYPGLHAFYRSKEERDNFMKYLQNHLKIFGESKNLTLDQANFADTCKCHEKSSAKINGENMFKKACDNSHSLFNGPPRSFVSKNKLFCAQAQADIATDALNLFKSMPRGRLFDGSMLNLHKSCSDLGYKQSAGEDPCYPGLHTFYRNRDDGEHFYRELQNHLKAFGESKNLTLDDANFADVCKCQEKGSARSNVLRWFNKSCIESAAPRSFVSKNKLFCAQASQSIASDALSLFKSMPRGQLYDGTMLNLQLSCSDMGYIESVGEDDCYPGLHIFYHKQGDAERFHRELQIHLQEFGLSKHLTLDEAKFEDTCKCHERSYAKSNVGKLFNKSCDNSHSNGSLSSFVSKNKLFCADAQADIATDALNLFKSMPRGSLFDGSMLNLQKSCSDLGYLQNAGEDPCYPGLRTFYRNAKDGEHFYRELQNHFKAFGENAHMTLIDVNVVDTCKCKEKSHAKNMVAKLFNRSCDTSQSFFTGSLHSFVSKNKLYCAHAQESLATDAINLFKSMPRGKLYDGTILNLNKSCPDIGYKQSAGEDPCYPGLHTFYRNKEEAEHFYRDLQKNLKDFGESKHLTLQDANFVDTCKCQEKSFAKNMVAKLFNGSCDNSPSLFNDAPRSFVSKNKLYCAQAQKGLATDALNLFKSMPRGKLYDGTILNFQLSCSDMGYKHSAGEDPCFPGLHTFYHNKEDKEQFMRDIQQHLREFGQSKDLTLDETTFVDTCKCHERSYAKGNVAKMFHKSCDNSRSLANGPPRSFVSKNKLFCGQAQADIATDALNRFKSMPRGKLYDGTILNLNKSCPEMGYKQSAGEDPCYPGLHTFYRNKEEGEHFVRELQNHLKGFGESRYLTLDEANFLDTCKCHEGSYAKKHAGKWFNRSCAQNDAPRSFVSKSKLFCAQAQESIATDAFNLFKSMPRGKLYDGTILNRQLSCSDMGYKQSAGEDQCYPGLHTFYHNKEEREQFRNELRHHLIEFGISNNLTLDEVNFMDTCKCQEGSYAKNNAGSCDKGA